MAARLPPTNIEIAETTLVQDLLDFLRRAECVAEQTRRDRIEVYVPRAHSAAQARREVALYLATWRARHQASRTNSSSDLGSPV
jgi:hypothetical protein